MAENSSYNLKRLTGSGLKEVFNLINQKFQRKFSTYSTDAAIDGALGKKADKSAIESELSKKQDKGDYVTPSVLDEEITKKYPLVKGVAYNGGINEDGTHYAAQWIEGDTLSQTTTGNPVSTGDGYKIYLDIQSNLLYRYDSSIANNPFREISPDYAGLSLGETDGTAYDGKKGKDLADKTAANTTGIEANAKEIASLENVVRKNHSAVTLTANPTLIEKGVQTDVTIAWNYSYDGSTDVKSVSVKNGSTDLGFSPTVRSKAVKLSDTATISLHVVAGAGNAAFDKTATVYGRNRVYYGFGDVATTNAAASASLTAAKVKALSSSLRMSAAGQCKSARPAGAASGYAYWFIAVPSSMSVKSVKQTKTGFGVAMASVTTPITSANMGKSEDYVLYRTNETVNLANVPDGVDYTVA